MWVLNNNEVDLKQALVKELEKPKKYIEPSISLKWLSVEGSVPKIKENSHISYKTEETLKEKDQNNEEEEKGKMNMKEIHLIDNVQSVLSKVKKIK